VKPRAHRARSEAGAAIVDVEQVRGAEKMPSMLVMSSPVSQVAQRLHHGSPAPTVAS
jgi:hypothetical protein